MFGVFPSDTQGIQIIFTIKSYRQRDLVPSFSIHIQRPCDDELKG
jgi:hypothetical protein